MMKKIGLVSDLHLEASNCEIDSKNWDYLVVAGDLSSDLNLIEDFFSYKAPLDIPIIYVLGNHEYERRDVDSTPKKIKEMLSFSKNIHVLDNESIVIDDIKFIGSTLWSNFELDGIRAKEQAMKWAEQNVVDFYKIFKLDEFYRYVPINGNDMLKMNEKAYKFLEFELKKNDFSGKKVVITHFAPHKKSVHENYKHTISSYWVNHFEELLGYSEYWFHGHTHNSFEYEVEGTVVACNPRGYSRFFNMSENRNYDNNKSYII